MSKRPCRTKRHSIIAFALLFAFVSAEANDDFSGALSLSMKSCQGFTFAREQFVCLLQTHDSLCEAAVMTGAVINLSEDRRQCLRDIGLPVFYERLEAALAEANHNPALQDALRQAYRQWRHNISQLLPQPLEPEYQYRLRRDSDEQALLFKVLSIDSCRRSRP